MSEIRLLYVTTKNQDQARAIAQDLIERKLVACANILPKMESIYFWQDQLQMEQESVLILKTEKSLVPEATQALIELHSYETPCVLSIPIEAGAEGYMQWLSKSVQR